MTSAKDAHNWLWLVLRVACSVMIFICICECGFIRKSKGPRSRNSHDKGNDFISYMLQVHRDQLTFVKSTHISLKRNEKNLLCN